MTIAVIKNRRSQIIFATQLARRQQVILQGIQGTVGAETVVLGVVLPQATVQGSVKAEATVQGKVGGDASVKGTVGALVSLIGKVDISS